MTRCIFVGPSLHGVTDRPAAIAFLPPAEQGHLIRAVESGARWIGLVDGYFGSCASVWHKEILHALSQGCHVWGAASMGALRAAECRAFGMRPVGDIAWRFVSGALEDDAEVALVHGPAEMGYLPITEAMVDVRPTIGAMLAAGTISVAEAGSLLADAAALHFGERTVEAILTLSTRSEERRATLRDVYETHRIRAKQADACELMALMCGEEPTRDAPLSWTLSRSASLERLLGPTAP